MWARFDALADLAAFEQLMRVNYLGAVYLTRYALPALKKSRGLIVAVASVAGFTGVPERTAYADRSTRSWDSWNPCASSLRAVAST